MIHRLILTLILYLKSLPGHYFEAAENFEDFHKLASAKKDWQDNEGISMHTIACDHLTRIYTTIGKQMEQQDPEQSLAYLVKAFNMAKEGKPSSKP